MQVQDLEYVGFWPRVGAALIDSLLVLVIIFPALGLIYGWAYFTDPNIGFVAGPADFILSWVLPAVGTVLFWVYKQATPGKMLIGARVVDSQTGSTLSVGQAIVRYLAYYVSAIPLLLGVFWVGFDPRKQGWHDKLAGTVVVRAQERGARPVEFGDR